MTHNAPATTEARIPPQAIEVEKAVLGCMMLESEATGIAVQRLKKEDFYKPDHREIFAIIAALYNENAPLDMLTIEDKLRDQGQLDQIGGSGYLAELTRTVSSAANIDYHAQILIEKAKKRQIILKCSSIINSAYHTDSDIYDVLDEWGSGVDELTLGGDNAPARTLAESLPETLDEIDAARKNPSNITGIPCGLDIDSWTSGWQPGDLIVIASRPSMGKTAALISMGRNIITNTNKKHRRGFVTFSLEMPRNQYIKRVLSQEGRIDNEHMRSGKVREEEFERLCTVTAPKLYDKEHTATMLIDDTPGLSMRVMRSKIRSYIRKYDDIGMVMIDYLQLMDTWDGQGHTVDQKIGYITKSLKNLAKELSIPIILFSQLSRAVETRGGDKRPQLSDLRESGNIEQDADIVVFIYRPEYYKLETDRNGNKYPENYAEFIIAKQRNGPVGEVPLYFKKGYTLFANRGDQYAEDTFAPPVQPALDDKKPF